MAGKTVVMVLDRDDPRRGEITMLGEPHEAARLAEDLIESGVEVERIRIFDATELEMRVAHKPVVTLGSDGGEGAHSYNPDDPYLEHDDPEPVAVHSIASDTQPHIDDAQSLSEEPLMRNGIRFSSLFKSDDF
jgi:hypothetical protein